MKMLAHYILFEKKIYKNSIVEITENRVIISKFEKEEANTEFHNGILLVSRKNYLNLIEHFSHIINDSLSIHEALKKITDEMGEDDNSGYYHLLKIYF